MALQIALNSASEHGAESDPDHEVGDLLELIETLWRHLSPDQQRAALLDYGEGRELWSPTMTRRLER
jgi:hypothetical protein